MVLCRIYPCARDASRNFSTGPLKAKSPSRWDGPLLFWVPDNDLLSHGSPYYHRRAAVSRSCSGWEGVVPARCARQEFGCESRPLGQPVRGSRPGIFGRSVGRDRMLRHASPRASRGATRAWGYRIKPHGQLVPVSLRPHSPSTSGLSTGWSIPTLQGGYPPGHLISRRASRLDAFSGYRFRT